MITVVRCAAGFVVGAAITGLLLSDYFARLLGTATTHQSLGGFAGPILFGGLSGAVALFGAALTVAKASRGAGQLILALGLGGVAAAAWTFFL